MMNTSRILSIAFCLLLLACSKDLEDNEPTAPLAVDYRAAWVGDYQVDVECSSFVGGSSTYSSYVDTISVAIIENSEDSILVGMTRLQIDTSGHFFESPWPTMYYRLDLWNDSIFIDQYSGGLGGGGGCEMLGAKIE